MSAVIIAIKMLHIASAIGFVVGITGRQISRAVARRSQDVYSLETWVRRSGYFERFLVIPGSQIVIIAGFVLAWLQGWPLFGFLQGARANWLLVSLVLSLLPFLFVVKVFIPRGHVFASRLKDALAQGVITPELRASFHDRLIRAAHITEGVIIVAVMYLMIAKPF